MPSFMNFVLFFGIGASLVSAAPHVIQKRSFTIERVRNANFKGHNGPRQLLKTYQKYGMTIPPALLEAINNRGKPKTTEAAEDLETTASSTGKNKGKDRKGSGSAIGGGNNCTSPTTTKAVGLVAAIPEPGDVEYLSPVQIGGQTVNLDFDSGSSDLWVFNTQLNTISAQGHSAFDPKKSSTFEMIQGASFSISYADGSGAAGNVGMDTVVLGGATVTRQAVELATAVSGSFLSDTANDGLLGLAFSKLNTIRPQQQNTFFDNVMPSLAEPLFTADLRKDAVGAYEFGRIDRTKFTGDIAWIPVNTTQGFWQFATAGFAVGDGKQQPSAPAQAIVDTGTTLILTSQEVTDGYYSQIDGAQNDSDIGGFTVPCGATMPDLILDVGGVYQARIKGEDINFAHVQGNTCFGGVQPSASDFQIWGDIFFKSLFVAFNGGNNSLGMAQHI